MKSWYTPQQEQAIQNWQNLQFGMFIHFGLYSLAGGCWNGQPVKKGYCEQIFAHGEIPPADYENLTKHFTVQNFDAEAIARLAKEAGMRYIVLTSKHHDGFCLFDTETTDYNSVKAACARDIVGETAAACKKEGLAFGLYFSLIDWHCPWAAPMSSHNSDYIPPQHHVYNLAQLTELLTHYGDICELWLDMGHPTKEQSQEMYALVHSLQKNIMINGRIWNDRGDFATMPDNELPELPYPGYTLNIPWQTPASIYKETWGYKSWQERGSSKEKIAELTTSLRSVSARGGNYLLNIGPDNTGALVPFEAEVLRGIGSNLKQEPLSRTTDKYGSQPQPLNNPHETKSTIGSIPAFCTNLFRYTGEDYYSLRPIVTGKRWTITQEQTVPPAEQTFILSWKSGHPLKEAVKLCFEDNEQRICFTLKQGTYSGVIGSAYRLPQAETTVLELSTIGSPLERPELPFTDIDLVLEKR